LQANVQRLKLYQSKLVIFPRKNSKRVKKGDSTAEACAAAVQVLTKQTIAIEQPMERIKARKISKEESEAQVATFLNKTRTDAKLWGKREKRATDKAKAAAADGGKKAAKDE
jgi:large subunit ribosomal protein L13e